MLTLNNYTPYQAAFSTGLMETGQYCVVVVVKATYDFPSVEGDALPLSKHQTAIFESDEFLGEPGYSSPLYENDFATHKPKCDLLIQAPVAYSPQTEPVESVEVGLECGSLNKRFLVIGKRYWEKVMMGMRVRPSQPQPFTEQALSWEIAYGGCDHSAYEAEELSESYLPNPIGTGFWHKPVVEQVENTPLAQIEALGHPITKPSQRHMPLGFSAVARNWQPRSQYGGSYDETWMRTKKPFLPDDFNPLYYQCAPADQQIAYPQGGEGIVLHNLTPNGRVHLVLPTLQIPVEAVIKNSGAKALEPVVDTVVIYPGEKKVSLLARSQIPFVHDINEIKEINVGNKSDGELAITTMPCRSCG